MREPARVADERVERKRGEQNEGHRLADGPVGRGEEEHRPTMESPDVPVNGRNGGRAMSEPAVLLCGHGQP